MLKSFEIIFFFYKYDCYIKRINQDFASRITLIVINFLTNEIYCDIFYHRFTNIVLVAETLQIFEVENIFNISLY